MGVQNIIKVWFKILISAYVDMWCHVPHAWLCRKNTISVKWSSTYVYIYIESFAQMKEHILWYYIVISRVILWLTAEINFSSRGCVLTTVQPEAWRMAVCVCHSLSTWTQVWGDSPFGHLTLSEKKKKKENQIRVIWWARYNCRQARFSRWVIQ